MSPIELFWTAKNDSDSDKDVVEQADQQKRYIVGVEVEGVGDGVEIHELHGEKILGQDTRLEAFKIDWLSNAFLKTWRQSC